MTGAMTPEERVLQAWVWPGRAPDFHRAAQRQLRKDWPMLAAALDDQAAAAGKPQPGALK